MDNNKTKLKLKGISEDFKRFYLAKMAWYFLYYSEPDRRFVCYVETKDEAEKFLDKNIKPEKIAELTFLYLDSAMIISGENVIPTHFETKTIFVTEKVMQKINTDAAYRSMIEISEP